MIIMYIAVGSQNPVKVQAVTKAAHSYFGSDVVVKGYAVASLVSHMPLSKEETRIGARNRAFNAYNKALSDGYHDVIGVGNEGGVAFYHQNWYLFGTSFATDGKREVFGGETQVMLPESMSKMLKDGTVELGDVIDELTGETNTKQRGGAIAVLTKQQIQREELFRFSSLMALSPWVHEFR